MREQAVLVHAAEDVPVVSTHQPPRTNGDDERDDFDCETSRNATIEEENPVPPSLRALRVLSVVLLLLLMMTTMTAAACFFATMNTNTNTNTNVKANTNANMNANANHPIHTHHSVAATFSSFASLHPIYTGKSSGVRRMLSEADDDEEEEEDDDDSGDKSNGEKGQSEAESENENENENNDGDDDDETEEEKSQSDDQSGEDVGGDEDESQEDGGSGDNDVENDKDNDRDKDKDKDNNVDSDDFDDDKALRVLYVVTSSGKSMMDRYNRKRNRWTGMVVPVLKQNIGSYFRGKEEDDGDGTEDGTEDGDEDKDKDDDSNTRRKYLVDLYMITSYTPSQKQKDVLRRSLPPSVGIQYWSDASPLMYHCKKYLNEPASTQFQNCILASEPDDKMFDHMKLAEDAEDFRRPSVRLREAPAQLARQHRLVIKDKLPYYDFFVVMEDDMMYTKTHVETHLRISEKAAGLRNQRYPVLPPRPQRQGKNNWNAPLERNWQRSMKAGFVRVEVLAASSSEACTRRNAPINWNVTDETAISIPEPALENTVDPNPCCRLDRDDDNDNDNDNYDEDDGDEDSVGANAAGVARQQFTDKPNPSADDLVIWEAKLVGFKLRPWTSISTPGDATNTSWFAAPLLGPKSFPGVWAGHQITDRYAKDYNRDGAPPAHLRYLPGGRLQAQTGGWLASAGDIVLYHNDLCTVNKLSFLPPFHFKKHPRDGLHRQNVEYWSGGLQIYSEKGCRVQRVYDMESAGTFSKHLVYHSSNNKQCIFKHLQEPPLIPHSIRDEIHATRRARAERVRAEREEAAAKDSKGSKPSTNDSGEKTTNETDATETNNKEPEFWENYIDQMARMVRVQNLWNHMVEARDGVLTDYLEEYHAPRTENAKTAKDATQ